ncbi:hypothetical protein C8F01DRAFT_1237590, partial [Mycena amicta]
MAPQQKSITDFFSLRKTLAAVPSAAATSPPTSSPPTSSPPTSSPPTLSAMSRPGGESTPASLRLPEDAFDDDEPEDAAVLRRDYIRYEQRGTNGIMEWTFRLARQRGLGVPPKECAWCFLSIDKAEVLYKCSLDDACLKGLSACQSCILIAHEHHPEHGFVDRYEESTGWIRLRRISDLGDNEEEDPFFEMGQFLADFSRLGQPNQWDRLGDIRYDAPLNASTVVGDQQIHASSDRRRVFSDVVNAVDPTKRRRLNLQDLVEDDSRLTDWTPMSEGNLDDVRQLAAAVSSYETEPDMDDVGGKAGAEKRKRYASSDDPMSVWVPHAPMFLEELLRREGLGDFTHNPHCARCAQAFRPGSDRIFRCTHCGDYLQCEECLRSEHQAHPLHVIKPQHKTNGRSGRPRRFLRCGYAPAAVHSARPATLCGSYSLMAGTPRRRRPGTCATLEALEQFRLLQVVGNVNVHDFVGTLERLTDPTRVDPTPDRYKAFFRMHRQHAYLMRGKRAGRAHESGGLEGTCAGGLAVSCWACPQPGRNLPEGWKHVARSHDCVAFAALLQQDTK